MTIPSFVAFSALKKKNTFYPFTSVEDGQKSLGDRLRTLMGRNGTGLIDPAQFQFAFSYLVRCVLLRVDYHYWHMLLTWANMRNKDDLESYKKLFSIDVADTFFGSLSPPGRVAYLKSLYRRLIAKIPASAIFGLTVRLGTVQ